MPKIRRRCRKIPRRGNLCPLVHSFCHALNISHFVQNAPTKRKNSRTASKSKKQQGKVSVKRRRSTSGATSKSKSKPRTGSEPGQPMDLVQNAPTKRKNSRTASKSKKQPGKVSVKRTRSTPGAKSKSESKPRTSSEPGQPMEFAEALLVSATSAAKLKAQRREGQDRRRKRCARLSLLLLRVDCLNYGQFIFKISTHPLHLLISTLLQQAGANHVKPPVRLLSRVHNELNGLCPH